ncbi:MAG TPA: hypothetical protein VJ672_03720 [Gemmatimonadaceae bacterium]|nr:hypothetical protein [Gemmatimonadaceae bacterium]
MSSVPYRTDAKRLLRSISTGLAALLRQRATAGGAPRWEAVVAAIALGCATAFCVLAVPVLENKTDFAPIYWSARALLDGVDPYKAVGPQGTYYQLSWPQLYPLPAILLVLPFAKFSHAVAVALFSGVGAAVLAYAVARDGYRRLPVFLSAALFVAAMLGQWSPVLTAAAMTSTLGFLFVVKPTIGLALFLYRPSMKAVIGAGVLVLISLAVMPTWPFEWLARIREHSPRMIAPVTTFAGPLLLLGALRWKRPEGRLFLALALIPQTLSEYEMLPLFLLAATLPQALTMAALTWFSVQLQFLYVDPGASFHVRHLLMADMNVGLVYLYGLSLLLRRPNEGDSPTLLAAALAALRRVRLAPRVRASEA